MKRIGAAAGYSLIELMITVAVLAILTAVVLPIYTKHRLKTNRQNGTQCLVEVQRQMESYYSRFNAYPALTLAGLQTASSYSAAADGVSANCPVSEGSTLYTVTLAASSVCSTSCYQLQASGIGPQANDGALLLLIDPRSSAASADAYHKQHIPPGGSAVDGWIFQPGKP